MPGMYAQFKTDHDIEKGGIHIEFESFRILVARAGGANKKFQRTMALLTKPYRRAVEAGTLGEERSTALLREAYAKSVILNWEVKNDEGNWVQGIEGEEAGEILPFTSENVVNTFEKLPDLFEYILNASREVGLFLEDAREVAAGNL